MDLKKEVLEAETIFEDTITIMLEDMEMMIHIPSETLADYFELDNTVLVETGVKERRVAGTPLPDYKEEYQTLPLQEVIEDQLTKDNIVEYLLNGGYFEIEDM